MESFRKSQVLHWRDRSIRDNGHPRFSVSLSTMWKSNNQEADNIASPWLLLGASDHPDLYKVRGTVVAMAVRAVPFVARAFCAPPLAQRSKPGDAKVLSRGLHLLPIAFLGEFLRVSAVTG